MSVGVYAASQQITNPIFDIEKANQQFEKINTTVSVKNVTKKNLLDAIRQLESLQEAAKRCIHESEEKLTDIDKLLKSQPPVEGKKEDNVHYTYLEDKKSIYAKQVAECRLFIFRSQEAIVVYKDTIQKLSTHQILYHGAPIWTIFDKATLQAITKINGEKIRYLMTAKQWTTLQMVVSIILLGCSILLGLIAKFLFDHWIYKQEKENNVRLILLQSIKWFVSPVLFFSSFSLFLFIIYVNENIQPALEFLSYAFLLYFLGIIFLKIIFYPGKNKKGLISVEIMLGMKCFYRTLFILSWLLLGYIITIIFRDQSLAVSFVDLSKTLFVSVLSFLIVWWCWLFFQSSFFKNNHQWLQTLIKVILVMLLAFLLITEWVGYHELTIYLEKGILYTILLISVTLLSFLFINTTIRFFNNNKYFLSQRVRYYLGIKPHKNFSELFLFQIAFYFFILFAFVLASLKIWGVSENSIDSFIDGIFNGFSSANLKIFPLRIIIAVVLFALLNIGGRFIATLVARHQQFEGEADTQVAIASIIHYVSFSVSLLIALIMAGVNFTGLAIIAGALSVGIGLGLQTIVNNFVSGIILLLEKPIKPGDRVVVGDTEGFVRKVRLRSTQITTMLKEDVIVPNYELVTTKVINYMFRDKNWRVSCQIGVKYGSNVELVKQILLEVAAKHPDVIQEPPNQPQVLFRSFGDSNLIFDLWCVIYDVNKKFMIASDLNFSINEAFKNHHITIAFPQRDLHIRDYVPTPPPPKE